MSGNGEEGFDNRISRVVADLGLSPGQAADATELRLGSRLVAVHAPGRLEVLLDPVVAAAAARTPDVTPSPRGPGWVEFAPTETDRYALDRAEAWLRSAQRLATTR